MTQEEKKNLIADIENKLAVADLEYQTDRENYLELKGHGGAARRRGWLRVARS